MLNGFKAEKTLICKESIGRNCSFETSRKWVVAVKDKKNSRTGSHIGYALEPGVNTLPLARSNAPILKRAGFAKHHLWITKYHKDERFPAGDFINQHPGGEGVEAWAQRGLDLRNGPVQLWYTMGKTHICAVCFQFVIFFSFRLLRILFSKS